MRFKNIGDLSSDISGWIPRLPAGFECVVGIPRSGMLVANILALKLNLPVVDLDGFLEGRMLAHGARINVDPELLASPRRVLIVDDSIASGGAMARVQERVAAAGLPHDIRFAAVYVTRPGACELYAEVLPNPRRFEWNILSGAAVEQCVFDIDGVLCVDPTPEENDDGERYRAFLRDARPLYVPAHEIGTLVTGRLEKYRPETEAWLAAHGVRYRHLHMLDLPSKADRAGTGADTRFKAETFKQSGAELFIESGHDQAVQIAELSQRFVYAVETQTMHGPGLVSAFRLRRQMLLNKRLRRVMRRLRRTLGSLR